MTGGEKNYKKEVKRTAIGSTLVTINKVVNGLITTLKLWLGILDHHLAAVLF